MNNIRTFFFALLCAVFGSINMYAQNSYQVVCKIDSDGTVSRGSLEELVEFVRNGNPIRVGWELSFKTAGSQEVKSFEHWTDAGFVTIINGHVFAQISSIYQQGPSFKDPPSVFLVDGKPNGWVAIIGTTGVLRQKFAGNERLKASLKKAGLSEAEIQKQLKSMETMKVPTKWAVLK